MKRSDSFSHRAFTLVEILIAVGILGMILVAIYASWNAILRGSRSGLEAAEDAQRGRVAVSALETALASIQMFEANNRYYSFITDTRGDFAYLSFVARLPASFPGSGLFGDQVLRRVIFAVETTNSERRLVMRQMPMLQPLEKGEEAYPIVLARDVNKFIVEFWNSNPRVNDWVDEWLFTNQVPKRIRVALAFGGRQDRYGSRSADVVVKDVFVPAMTIPREWQMPGAGPNQNPNAPTNPIPIPRVPQNPNFQQNRLK